MLSGLHLVPEHQVPAEGADISHTAAANQLHVVGKLLAIPARRHATHLMEGKNVLCTMWNRLAAVGIRFVELFQNSTHPYSSGAASAAALRAVMASVIGRAAPRMTGLDEIWR